MGDWSLDGLEPFVDVWPCCKLFVKRDEKKNLSVNLPPASVHSMSTFFLSFLTYNVNPCFENSNNPCKVSLSSTEADLKVEIFCAPGNDFFFSADSWAVTDQADNSKHSKDSHTTSSLCTFRIRHQFGSGPSFNCVGVFLHSLGQHIRLLMQVWPFLFLHFQRKQMHKSFLSKCTSIRMCRCTKSDWLHCYNVLSTLCIAAAGLK